MKREENYTIDEMKARFVAHFGIRKSSVLEDLHQGITPASKTGDFSDVKVVTPFGEIPWTEVSRIRNKEMRELMLDIEKKVHSVLDQFAKLQATMRTNEEFAAMMHDFLFEKEHISWDLPENVFQQRKMEIDAIIAERLSNVK